MTARKKARRSASVKGTGRSTAARRGPATKSAKKKSATNAKSAKRRAAPAKAPSEPEFDAIQESAKAFAARLMR